jgi:phosphoribosylformylglycinamidine synthase
MSGYGINCEDETAHAFNLAGGISEIVHINKLIDNPQKIQDFQIMAYPGGFAYGDDTGAGKAYANKLKNNIWDHILKFIEKDTLTIGICNGFQIITQLGLLPAIGKKYGTRQAALVTNDNARYLNRWVDLEVKNKTPWLTGITHFSCPIAHGEGKFYADQKTLERLKNKKQIALLYTEGEVSRYLDLPANPNGSLLDIAGITDETGRILGLMPHPERGMFYTQRPDWSHLAKKNKKLPELTNSIKIFQNATKYFG